MGTRIELQALLEKIFESPNVYYQPPESKKIDYPAIVYSKNKINPQHADDIVYQKSTQYTLTVIDKRPDNAVIEKLLTLPYCAHDTHYVSDNLNHDKLTLFF